MRTLRTLFKQTILTLMAEDGLDKYRKEYNKLLHGGTENNSENNGNKFLYKKNNK